jgi:bifunctional isochorismate lyase/aryl carrier protein
MQKQCLLIIDLQNDFLDSWEAGQRASLIAETNKLVATFRKRELPIFWVRQEFRADLADAFLEMRDRNVAVTIEGTRGAEFNADLDWRPEDTTLIKKRYSPFFGTNLEDLLKEHGIAEVVIAGINTHACVRMAAIDAYQRDLRVVLVLECVGSHDERHERISLDYLDGKIAKVMSIDEFVASQHILDEIDS